MDRAVSGLCDYCSIISTSDVRAARHLVDPSRNDRRVSDEFCRETDRIFRERSIPSRLACRFVTSSKRPTPRRVAFVFNSINPTRELISEEPGLAELSLGARLELLERLQVAMRLSPTPLFATHLFDQRIWLSGILIPATAEALTGLGQSEHRVLIRQRMQEALDLAVAQACECVVFGAQTSVVTDACRTS
ncbi:MAG: hypothetical protein R3B96_16225 [Pirellulaceae bacterium]